MSESVKNRLFDSLTLMTIAAKVVQDVAVFSGIRQFSQA